MRRPNTALFDERTMIDSVPVARGNYLQAIFREFFNVEIERRNDSITIAHRKSSSWQKIILHIYNDESIAVSG